MSDQSQSGNRTALDPEADPPTVEDVSEIKAMVRYRLGRRLYVHAIERLPNGDYLAYLGFTRSYDTSAAGGEAELSFVNYAPVGAVRAHSVADGDHYELDFPGRDALIQACRTRRHYEGDHRAALVPGLTNTLEKRRKMHYEEYSEFEPEDGFDHVSELDLDDAEMERYGFHRGMARMAGLLDRRVAGHLGGPYAGNRRWSKHDTRDVIKIDQ